MILSDIIDSKQQFSLLNFLLMSPQYLRGFERADLRNLKDFVNLDSNTAFI